MQYRIYSHTLQQRIKPLEHSHYAILSTMILITIHMINFTSQNSVNPQIGPALAWEPCNNAVCSAHSIASMPVFELRVAINESFHLFLIYFFPRPC